MKNGTRNILVVEDDPAVRNLISITLSTHDYNYSVAENGTQAIMEATTGKVDVILLDLGLPDMDGIQVIEKVRSFSGMPVIVISARSDDRDKIQALDAGADDYLTKPFSVDELLARLRSTFRRIEYLQAQGPVEQPVFVNGKLKIDYTTTQVMVDGEEIHLMPIEYSILCLLAKNVGKVLTHSYIMDKVWVNAIESDLSSLRVYMALLRKKIEKNGEKGQYIQTHVGIGYRMVKREE